MRAATRDSGNSRPWPRAWAVALLLVASYGGACDDSGTAALLPNDAAAIPPEDAASVHTDADSTDADTPDLVDASADDSASLPYESPFVAKIPMRDGVGLHTMVILPDSVPQGGVATVLLRTPYRFAGPYDEYYRAAAEFHAQRGYAFALQDCRGRFDSEGEFHPFVGEIEDGRDTTQWLTRQPWSNGRIVTVGGSYNGFTAVAASIDNPDVVAVIADDPAVDLSYNLRGGAPSLFPLVWLSLLDTGEDLPAKELANLTNSLDAASLDQALLGRTDSLWQGLLRSSSPSDPFWDSRSLRDRFGGLCAPMLLVKSQSEPWEDPVEIFEGAREQGCQEHQGDHRLVITPDGHTHHLSRLGFESTEVNEWMLGWIDAWTAGSEPPALPVVQHSPAPDASYAGAGEWPAGHSEQAFYLANPNGVLDNAPLAQAPPDVGGTDGLFIDPESMDPCGDYPVRTYVTDILAQPVALAGAARLEAFLTATAPSADLGIALFEYDPTEDPALDYLGYGITRAALDPTSNTPQPVTVKLQSFSHVFAPGTRIALALTSTLCGYPENPQTGEPPWAQTAWNSANIEVHWGADFASKLVLPVIAPDR